MLAHAAVRCSKLPPVRPALSQLLRKQCVSGDVARQRMVVVAAPANIAAVADVVLLAQRPGRGSSLNLAQ
jgi:hypothetical protein